MAASTNDTAKKYIELPSFLYAVNSVNTDRLGPYSWTLAVCFTLDNAKEEAIRLIQRITEEKGINASFKVYITRFKPGTIDAFIQMEEREDSPDNNSEQCVWIRERIRN
jgi:hypothetical protein